MQTHVSEAELLAQYIDKDTGEIIYPTSDGNRMAESTEHFEQITTLQGNLESLFSNKTDVFVAGDLLWYPEQGKPYICVAPDTMVVFGRPKMHRGSYEQWNEENIAPAVVFEILSKSNTPTEMFDKLLFYEKYGVQECYMYDYIKEKFYGWIRNQNHFEAVLIMPTFQSPLLNITFEFVQGERLKIFNPDGTQFLTFVQQSQKRQEAEARAEQEKERAEKEKERAEQEKERAEKEKKRAEHEKERAEEEKARAEKAEQEIAMIKKILQEKGFNLEY